MSDSKKKRDEFAVDEGLTEQYRNMSAEELKGLLKNAVLIEDAKNNCLQVLTEKIGQDAATDFKKTHLSNTERGFPVILRAILAFFPLIIGCWLFFIQIFFLLMAVKIGTFHSGMLFGYVFLMLVGLGFTMLGTRMAKWHQVRFLLLAIVFLCLSAWFFYSTPLEPSPSLVYALDWSKEVMAIVLLVFGIASLGFSFFNISKSQQSKAS